MDTIFYMEHLKRVERIAGFILAALFALGLVLLIFGASGCGTTKQIERTEVHDTTWVIQPPTMEEYLPLDPNENGFEAWRMEGRDTVTLVRVDTVNKTAYVKMKPDSVRITDHDTTTITRYETVVEETPLLSKLGIGLIGAIAALGGVAGAYLFFKSRVI